MSSLPTVAATLPGFVSFPSARPSSISAEFLRTPWRRWLRRRRSSFGIESRLRRAAARGRPIVLGSLERPYEPPVAGAEAPLSALRPYSGLQIAITARSPRLLCELDTLSELDRDHAVQVDVVISGPDLRSPAVRDGLSMVRRLASEGIQTRIYIPPPATGTRGAERWRRFFEAARSAGAWDVTTADVPTEVVHSEDVHSEDGVPHGSWRTRFQRLRMQHGFPSAQPGRG